MKARISLLLLQVHLTKAEAADLYLNGERQEDTLPHVCCWGELVSRMCTAWFHCLDVCSWSSQVWITSQSLHIAVKWHPSQFTEINSKPKPGLQQYTSLSRLTDLIAFYCTHLSFRQCEVNMMTSIWFLAGARIYSLCHCLDWLWCPAVLLSSGQRELIPWGKNGQCLKLSTHLIPGLGMHGAVTSTCLWDVHN